jgi:hypothetical protein
MELDLPSELEPAGRGALRVRRLGLASFSTPASRGKHRLEMVGERWEFLRFNIP